jgi:hypothetical protein
MIHIKCNLTAISMIAAILSMALLPNDLVAAETNWTDRCAGKLAAPFNECLADAPRQSGCLGSKRVFGIRVPVNEAGGTCWLESGKPGSPTKVLCDKTDFARLGLNNMFVFKSTNSYLNAPVKLTTLGLMIDAIAKGENDLWSKPLVLQGPVANFGSGQLDSFNFPQTGQEYAYAVPTIAKYKNELQLWTQEGSSGFSAVMIPLTDWNLTRPWFFGLKPNYMPPMSFDGLLRSEEMEPYDAMRRLTGYMTDSERSQLGERTGCSTQYNSDLVDEAMLVRKGSSPALALTVVGPGRDSGVLNLALRYPGKSRSPGSGNLPDLFKIDPLKVWEKVDGKGFPMFAKPDGEGDFILRRYSMDGDILLELTEDGFTRLHLLTKTEVREPQAGKSHAENTAGQLGFSLQPLCADKSANWAMKVCSGDSKPDQFHIVWVTKPRSVF